MRSAFRDARPDADAAAVLLLDARVDGAMLTSGVLPTGRAAAAAAEETTETALEERTLATPTPTGATLREDCTESRGAVRVEAAVEVEDEKC